MAASQERVLNRAEHVGSFLRSPSVKEARAKGVSGSELRAIEDEAIAKLVKLQVDNGLLSVSDGEQRRQYFHLDFLQNVGGISISSNLEGDKADAKPPTLSVSGKLQWVKPIQVDDYKFVRGELDKLGAKDATVKVAIPSPTMVHFRGGRASINIDAYPNLDAFFEDLGKVYRDEIKALVEAGATFIQLDDTNLAYLCDDKMREAARGRGDDPDTLPKQYAALINAAIRDRPDHVTIGLHLCRGNFKSRSFAEGGYEPIAKVLFNDLNVDTYFLEFDDDRSGNFEPLRALPKGGDRPKTVVLGIVSSKTGKLEDKDAMVARIREAAKYAPLEQLAVSAQCGFASTAHGNDISEEEQWAKVRLVRDIAKEVWGSS